MYPQRAESALLNGEASARRFFADCVGRAGEEQETLWVAHVDDQARCLHLSRHDGTINGVAVPVAAILREAALLGSAAVVLAHNHPSGDSTPSAADCQATRALATAGEALDLTLLDHFIFAGGECHSFRRMGLL